MTTDRFLFYRPSDRLDFGLPKLELRRPLDFVAMSRFGVGVAANPMRILTIDFQNGPGAQEMRADGWTFACAHWLRLGGVISHRRQASGRYAHRLPTNRRRKRERAKARRRERMQSP